MVEFVVNVLFAPIAITMIMVILFIVGYIMWLLEGAWEIIKKYL